MTSAIPRYEAHDEASRNVRFRLYRYMNPGWTNEGDLVLTPTADVNVTLSIATLGTGALGV